MGTRPEGHSLLPEIPPVLEPFVGKAKVALVLGSGLSGLVDRFDERTDVDYDDIEGFPTTEFGVAGHAGKLSLAISGEESVLAFQGRVHAYQGFNAFEASYTARLAAALGCEVIIVTNAAGGVDPTLAPGEIMLITDQLNLTGDSPLIAWPGPDGGTPFVPMGAAFDEELISLATRVAGEQALTLRQGHYAGLLGPAYETPAEVSMLHPKGAHAVGMSTVHEVIAARALGLRVMGISLISNSAGDSDLSHEEVLEAGRLAADAMTELLLGVVRSL